MNLEELKAYIETGPGLLWFDETVKKAAAYADQCQRDELSRKFSEAGFLSNTERQEKLNREIEAAREKRERPIPARATRSDLEKALSWPHGGTDRKISLYLGGSRDDNVVKVALLNKGETMGHDTEYVSGDISDILSGRNMVVKSVRSGQPYIISLTG